MILGGGLITQALAGGGTSGGGKAKPITITENGTYNVSDAEKAEGYVGFAPVTVDVPQSSGFLTLEQLAALPTLLSYTYGNYRTDFKIYVDASPIARGVQRYPKIHDYRVSPPEITYDFGVFYEYNKTVYLCRVIYKNNVPIWGAYSVNNNAFGNSINYSTRVIKEIVDDNNVAKYTEVEIYKTSESKLDASQTTITAKNISSIEQGGNLYAGINTVVDSVSYGEDGSVINTSTTGGEQNFSAYIAATSGSYGSETVITNLSHEGLNNVLCDGVKAFYDTYKK